MRANATRSGLSEPMDEEDAPACPTPVAGEAFAYHRQRHLAPCDEDLLHERVALVPIDGLVNVSAEEDQNELAWRAKR